MKFQVVINLAAKEKSECGEVKYIDAGIIVRCVEANNREEARSTFQSVRNDVIENMIRFYLHDEVGLAVILSRNGEWDGFKKPKGARRLYPKKVQLVSEGEDGFDGSRWVSENNNDNNGGND